MALSFTEGVAVLSDVLVKLLGDEAVLLHTAQQRYYGLDQVGTRMWTELISSSTIDVAYQRLLEEYEVDPENLRRDLTELVEKLAQHRLIALTAPG